MPQPKTHWIRGLDSIRFFLAFIVLLSHLPDPFVIPLKQSPVFIVHAAGIVLNHSINGVAAVIAFFLISGFVIHYPNVGRDKIDVAPFLIRRWLRLGIPLFVMSVIAACFHASGSMPFWSLCCELIYYTLYPLLYRLKGTWRAKFYAFFVIALIAIVLLNMQNLQSLLHQRNINFHGTYACNGVAFTWIIGLPCWLLGVVLAAHIHTVSYSVSVRDIWLWRVMVLAGSMLCLALKAHLFVSYVVSLNFFALVLYPWLKREIIYYKDHRPLAVFEYFGRFSYSLYIVHKLVFILLAASLPLRITTYFIYIVISIITAYVFYLVVEYPAHLLARYISKLIPQTKPVT